MRQNENIDELDNQLYHLFSNDDVPEQVNIAIKDKINYAATNQKIKPELWWLPAVLNTAIAITGVMFAVVIYLLTRIGGSFTIMPNLIGKISELGLKAVLALAYGDMLFGWLTTAIAVPIASEGSVKNNSSFSDIQ